jgi:hypothetical protein
MIDFSQIKIQVSEFNPNCPSLEKVKQQNLKKLSDMKHERGYTKEKCYSNFPKRFVDANFDSL